MCLSKGLCALPAAKGWVSSQKALRTGAGGGGWGARCCRKGFSTHLSLGGLEEGELLRGRCLGVWSVAGTQRDKEQEEKQGCGALARTRAQSRLRKYFDSSEAVLFHSSTWGAWRDPQLHTLQTPWLPVNCWFAPEKFRGLGQNEERLVPTRTPVVFGAASGCAHLFVPQFPYQKWLTLLLFLACHAGCGWMKRGLFGVPEIGQTAKSNEGL